MEPSTLDKKEIGLRLKQFLKGKFSSIDEAGIHLETTGNTLRTTYLNGKSLPGAELIYKLLLIGCDINWLFTGESLHNSDNQVFNDYIRLKEENKRLRADIQNLPSFISEKINEIVNNRNIGKN